MADDQGAVPEPGQAPKWMGDDLRALSADPSDENYEQLMYDAAAEVRNPSSVVGDGMLELGAFTPIGQDLAAKAVSKNRKLGIYVGGTAVALVVGLVVFAQCTGATSNPTPAAPGAAAAPNAAAAPTSTTAPKVLTIGDALHQMVETSVANSANEAVKQCYTTALTAAVAGHESDFTHYVGTIRANTLDKLLMNLGITEQRQSDLLDKCITG